jgi:hypothetical protein
MKYIAFKSILMKPANMFDQASYIPICTKSCIHNFKKEMFMFFVGCHAKDENEFEM